MRTHPLALMVVVLGSVVSIATSPPQPYSWSGSGPIGAISLDSDVPGHAIDAFVTTTGDLGPSALSEQPTLLVELSLENYGPTSGRVGLYRLDEPWDGTTPPDDASLLDDAPIGGALGDEPERAELRLGGEAEVPEEVHLLLWIMEGELQIEGEGDLVVTLSSSDDQEDVSILVEVQ